MHYNLMTIPENHFQSYLQYIASYDDLCDIAQIIGTDYLTLNSFGKGHFEEIGSAEITKGIRKFVKFDSYKYIANFIENANEYWDYSCNDLDHEVVFYTWITVGYVNKVKLNVIKNAKEIIYEYVYKIKKNLIFVSAGENTSFYRNWSGMAMNYDIYCVYYGKNVETYKYYKKRCKYVQQRPGSKFQNFCHYYKIDDVFNKYEYFFVLDDDIIFNVCDINKMFEIANKYKLKICGPTFDNKSKISHIATRSKRRNTLRYTNFVEVNVPLFSKSAVKNFMKYEHPSLVGWGIDYLYIWANGIENKNSFALVDSVVCTNPRDKTKEGSVRELTKLENYNKRSVIWNKYCKTINCPRSYKIVTHSEIRI